MKKRIISLLMCLVMAFSMVPAAAWAEVLPPAQDTPDSGTGTAGVYTTGEDTAVQTGTGTAVQAGEAVARIDDTEYASLPAALNAAKDGETVTLLADHEEDVDAIMKGDLSTMAVVKERLTLDLNGFTVDSLTVGDKAIVGEIYDDEREENIDQVAITAGDLTVVDSSEGASGSIAELEFISGKLKLESGIIGKHVDDGTPTGRITCEGDYGNENITGETTYGGEISITGGTVYNLYAKENVTVTVTGGTGHRGNWANDAGKMTITGGSFANPDFSNNGGTIAISGGAFESITNNDASGKIPLMPLLADGYAFFDKDGNVLNGTAKTLTDVEVKRHTHSVTGGVCPCGAEFVASVTPDEAIAYYTTLQGAVDNAKDGDTITLLNNVALTKPLSFEQNFTTYTNDFVLDLNGWTISCDNGAMETLYVSEAKLAIRDSSSEKTGKVTQNAAYAVWVEAGGTLTITGGSFGLVRVGSMGRAMISGGSFSTIDSSGSSGSLADLLADGYAFANSTTNEIINGYTSTNAENITVVPHAAHVGSPCACGYTCGHPEMDSATGNCADCGKLIAQASVKTGESTVYYTQLTDAVTAAVDANGSTVTLLQDVILPDGDNISVGGDMYKNYNFTIDWNGHILSGNTWKNLLVFSQHTNVTLMDSSGSDRGGVRNNYASLGFEGGTAVCVSVLNGYCVTIEGGTYSAQVLKLDCVGDLKIQGGVFENPAKSSVSYAISSSDRNRNDEGALADLLSDGYTFAYDANGTELLNVYTNAHTEKGRTVYVVSHTHDFTGGTCVCGIPCQHELDSNNYCAKCDTTFVAKVNSDYYATVTAALAAAPSGSTVTLLSDAVTESVTFAGGDKSVTLDMTGKTLTAADIYHPALTVESGTLTVSGDAAFISQGFVTMSMSDTQPAILVTGGKLVFTGALTAVGGWSGNAMSLVRRQFAVKATGGELDFKGGLNLKGGLAVMGTAVLTNKLTQGTFWVDRSKDENEMPVYAVIAVGTGRTDINESYKNVRALLADGRAFAKEDSGEIWGATALSCSDNVTIVLHEHTWEAEGELYTCTVCGESCAHEGGYKTGACTVCGKPCPHAIADQSPADHNYYCNECGIRMFARIKIRANNWAHFTNLADAMAAAEDGQTVVLLSDIDHDGKSADITGDGKTVTLDLNGKTITGGWISVGGYEQHTTSTLKIIGRGSFVLLNGSGDLTVWPGGTLDMTEWEGGTFTRVQIGDDAKVDEAIRKKTSLIVGEKAGTITELNISNWQLSADDTANMIDLSGGSYGQIRITGWNSNVISLGTLLSSGYAFNSSDGHELYDRTLAESPDDIGDIYNVSVAKCLHTGFEALTADGKCPYCDTGDFVALVETSDGVLTAYEDIYAADAKLKNGDTMTLLDNNAAGLSIYNDITLDLNGFYAGMVEIYAPVKLRNSKTTGGEIPSLSIGRADTVLGDLLADGYSLKDNTGKWLSVSELLGTSAENITVAKTAVSAVSFLSYVDTLSYGSSAMLSISTGGISCTYQWYEQQNGTWNPIECTESNYSTPGTLSCGSYTYRCAVTDSSGATVLSDTATVTVTPADLSQAVVKLKESTFTYDPQNSGGFSPVVTSVRLNGRDVPAEAYTIGGDTTASQAGSYTLTVTAVEGSNYTGTASVSWTIDPCTLAGIRLAEPFKTYDGSPVTENNVLDYAGQTFKYGITDEVGLGNDSYTITLDSHTFTSANAGNGEVTFTVTLLNGSYTFKDAALKKVDTWTFTKPVTIAQASLAQEDWPATALTVRNNWEKTYTLDVSKLLPTLSAGHSYGMVKYEMGPIKMDTIYQAASPTVDAASGILTLSINSVDTDVEKQIGTIKVNVVTTNYETFEITVDLTAANKSVPAPNGDLTASGITYGQKLGDSTITGEMQVNGQTINGTFTWDDPTDELPAGTHPGLAWTFTPDASYGGEYASAAGTISVEVNKAAMTASVEQGLSLIYDGTPQQAAVTTTTKTVDGTPAQFTYAKVESGPYGDMPAFTDAGSYTVWYCAEDFGQNHEKVYGTFTVTIDKADSSVTAAPAANTLTYTGAEQALVTPGTAEGGTMQYSLDGVTYAAAVPTAKLPGTYTVYYKVQGDSNHHDTKPADVAVTIAPAQLTNVSASAPALTYNGKAQTPAVTVTADTVDGAPITVTYSAAENGAYTASIPSYSAVGSYTLYYRLAAANHETASGRLFINVDKAQLTVPDIKVDVTNGLSAYYTVDIQAALNKVLPAGCVFGKIVYGGLNITDQYGYCDGYRTEISRKGVLTLAVESVDTAVEGEAAVVLAFVTTDNYQDITVTVRLCTVNKSIPTGAPQLSTRTITGGQRLSDIALSGSMMADGKVVRGTFVWAEPYFCPGVGSYAAAWIFTPDEAQYAVVTGTADITVLAPAEPTYTVSGEVKEFCLTLPDQPSSPVADAAVTIRRGLEVIGGWKTTDAEGRFSLDGVPAGVYNVVVEYNGRIVTRLVTLVDHNVTGLLVEIPREDVNSELTIRDATDLTDGTVVGGLDSEAAKRFPKGDGNSLSVSMDIREVPASDSDAVQKAIRGEAGGRTLEFVDMTLLLVQNGVSSDLPETETLLEIILSYDTSRSGIAVLCSHNGVVQALTERGQTGSGEGFYVDKANGRIHIFARQFSTYAIGYTEPDRGPTVKDTTSPATGDAGLVVYAAIALSSCTGTALQLRRKREHE